MQERLDSIRSLFPDHGADAALITFLPNIRWTCGFTGSNGLLIVLRDTAHFVTDGRYAEQVSREVAGATVHIAPRGLVDFASGAALLAGATRVIVQSDHLTLDLFDQLQEGLKGLEWVPVAGLLQNIVAVKTSDEVGAIRRAQAVTDAVFEDILAFIAPRMTEHELAAEIVYQHLRRGASAMSFEPIVASGPNGALPHARPTSRALEVGDLVVLDMGCFVDGYASDMTRTVAIGTPEDEAVRVYDIVLDAHLRALEAAHAGMTGKMLDAIAREVISEGGYGPHFAHSLGHGVGLQIHEWPSVSFRTEDVLPEGAVITIEPGIYLAGRFGVRIEDMALLGPTSAESLANSPKQLIRL
ncbi:MAG: aminopeptidase P family protein [Rhodothermales bacterium]|nr:aminopeptidase P family protein [Rhodothermales bacterium]